MNVKTGIKGLFIILVVVVLGCKNEIVFTPASSLNLTTGIFVTDETSSEPVYIFGNPREKKEVFVGFEEGTEPIESESGFVKIFTPYPNPSDGYFQFQLRTPKPIHVKIWIETAYFSANGVISLEEERIFERIELVDTILDQGTHYSFNLPVKTRCLGGNLEQGFYRIFVLIDNEHILYTDVYIVGYSHQTPIGMVTTAPTLYPCDYFEN